MAPALHGGGWEEEEKSEKFRNGENSKSIYGSLERGEAVSVHVYFFHLILKRQAFCFYLRRSRAGLGLLRDVVVVVVVVVVILNCYPIKESLTLSRLFSPGLRKSSS